MPKDYYAILKVPRDASEDDIRRAYRQLALKYHPDKNRDDETAETKFREVKDAYELLCNVLKRRSYDQHNPPEQGEDLEYSLEVRLKNGEDGSRIPIEDITFKIGGRKIRLILDKGDGRYQLRGAGEVGSFGGDSGDLFVTVNAAVREPDVPQTILGNDGTEMVLIPAGEFLMGSNDVEAFDEETPLHSVYLDAFYMDKYEVTNAQFKAFVDTNPRWRKDRISDKLHGLGYLKNWDGDTYPSSKANHPVVYVSWYAAMAYAEWAGKRLPTEAEWEKAARGGLSSQKYPWGNAIDSTKANYGRHVDDTTIVGKYPANGYGLHDMSGNVWEWCLDEYNPNFYSVSPDQTPLSSANSIQWLLDNYTSVDCFRVLRGGSWSGSATVVRVAVRSNSTPTNTLNCYGFRCVKYVTQ